MKRINQYKKLFNVESDIDLKELKSKYRSLVKEWHPDKFQEEDEKFEEAKAKSLEIIDGYHFLVGISEETKISNQDEYNASCETGIDDFRHKGQVLEVTFMDSATYEYFGVSKAAFTKFLNADKQLRFAKRNIFHSYVFRKTKKSMEA